MPSPFVPLPPYPIVPPLPGVPPLPAPIGGLDLPLPALVAFDALGLPLLSATAQWGIWSESGEPILLTDATFSVEYARDYRISDYPQVSGAFQSYNKVQQPFQARVEFLISATRDEFLQNVEAACASLDLVTVVTPEIQYPSANLTHYSFRREASNGVTLIKVEVWCEEVRETAGAALSATTAAQPGSSGGTADTNFPTVSPTASGSFSNSQSPNAQPQSNDGLVQPTSRYIGAGGSTFSTSNLPPPT